MQRACQPGVRVHLCAFAIDRASGGAAVVPILMILARACRPACHMTPAQILVHVAELAAVLQPCGHVSASRLVSHAHWQVL